VSPDGDVLLEVEDLRTYVYTSQGTVKAVDGVSFSLRRGETLGIVGESGSGKSMTCLSLVRLVPGPAARIVGGEVQFRGEDLLAAPESRMRQVRGRHLAMILQDPMASLNPALTIGDQVAEPLRLHQGLRGGAVRQAATAALKRMRISWPEQALAQYQHNLSGGMRQRVAGAIALACQPEVLIADEPTTSLDATIQVQYLALLKQVQAESGLAIIFVTHDFGIVAKMCDRVAVMYAGRIVEAGSVRDIFHRPAHPYTEALLRSIPRLDEELDRLPTIEGQPPALHALGPGCSFAPRCAYVQARCKEAYPPTSEHGPGHTANCWHTAPVAMGAAAGTLTQAGGGARG
jgi:oligopeptide/dipeptide ABC transporter ATP-binding protein